MGYSSTHLLKQLATARRRTGLSSAELADKVTASAGFAPKYQSGEHGPIVLPKRANKKTARNL